MNDLIELGTVSDETKGGGNVNIEDDVPFQQP